MSFIPNTEEDRKKALETIGAPDFETLIEKIPESVRLKGDLNLPPRLSEFEAYGYLKKLADMNKGAELVCFAGGGAYDVHTPAVVSMALERSEFKTAYTPYQAEVSQGTLQAMYEFQSMIAALTGMEAANASLYDGGSALGEACLMANAQNRKTEFVYAGRPHPNYKRVVSTVCGGGEFVFKDAVLPDGSCDLQELDELVSDKTSAVIVQQPNFCGSIDDVDEISKIAKSKKALLIVMFDPISLGLIKSPGEYDADIAVGEGQSLGIPLSYGGPYLGLFATKLKYIRKAPGRLAGMTVDADGKRGFALTLQTREQQIKRERATSNICTNQGLYMLAAAVYTATMGKEGIREIAELSFRKAHYLAAEIDKISGYERVSEKPFFREFLLRTPVPAAKIVAEGKKRGILCGIDTKKFSCEDGLLIAVTEKRTKEEMDALAEVLKKFEK